MTFNKINRRILEDTFSKYGLYAITTDEEHDYKQVSIMWPEYSVCCFHDISQTALQKIYSALNEWRLLKRVTSTSILNVNIWEPVSEKYFSITISKNNSVNFNPSLNLKPISIDKKYTPYYVWRINEERLKRKYGD